MTLYGAVWSSLTVFERKKLIFAARPETLEGIAQLEARRRWQQLQPAMQDALNRVDWNVVLDRKVIECNQTHG